MDTYSFIEGSVITESLNWEYYHQLHRIVMSEHYNRFFLLFPTRKQTQLALVE
nr:MAG TPA_asm: hypothetical protein [Caudoviricetes sp.]